MYKVLINGDRAYLPVDGMNRVLLEITKSLDAIVEKDNYILVIPSNVDVEFYESIKELKNIRIKKTILPYFRFWTLIFVDIVGLLYRKIVINFANRNSVFGGGVNILHDIIPLTFYGERSKKYLRRIQRLLNKSECLIVPSHFTQQDIKKTINCKMEIIHLGWQHYPKIQEDDEIFDIFPALKNREFSYSILSISPHKNLKFIYELAKRNPDDLFVIAGGMNRGYGFDFRKLNNLIFTGRISDQKSKSLMVKCKAFIFPSLYEGAGLPPLEALSCGKTVLASNIDAVREYCGDAVHYFDPEDYNIDLQNIMESKVSDSKEVLKKLSWDKAAEDLINIIRYNLRS